MRGYHVGTIAALGFPVGAAVVFLSLIVFTGSVNNATQLLVISIVCTAGVALVFWVPLCTGTGMLVVFLAIAAYRGVQGATQTRDAPLDRALTAAVQPAVSASRNAHCQAVADYIRKAKAKGYSDSQIDTRLAARGWETNEIEQARRLLSAGAAR